jgi:hypothetical protein
MKSAIIVLFFLVSSVTSFKPPTLESPSLVTITVAQACDEFHGDYNCTCQQSIINPCCPWWQPWKCPPAAKARVKAAAAQGSDYLSNAKGFLGAAEVSTCGAGILAGITGNLGAAMAMGVPCIGSMAGSFAAGQFKDLFDQVNRDPWDNLWWQDYEGMGLPSLESVGIVGGYSGWWWTDRLIDDALWGVYYADFIYVTANRLSTCYQLGYLDICARQKYRADWGFAQLGYVTRDVAVNLRAITDAVEAEVGGGDLVSVLDDVSDVTDWVGWEFQNNGS